MLAQIANARARIVEAGLKAREVEEFAQRLDRLEELYEDEKRGGYGS